MNDPAAQVTLTVVRSEGGEGAVTLLWQVDELATEDLSPRNGTLVFTEVQNEGTAVALLPHLVHHTMLCIFSRLSL